MLPVTPSSFSIRVQSKKTAAQSAATKAITASRIVNRIGSPSLRPAGSTGAGEPTGPAERAGGGDRAGARHQWNGEREGRDVAHVLLDCIFRLTRLPLDAYAEH